MRVLNWLQWSKGTLLFKRLDNHKEVPLSPHGGGLAKQTSQLGERLG